MKVILLCDDKKLGKKNSVVEVADSYARNVLIPRQQVIPANNVNLNVLKNKLEKEKYDHEKKISKAKEQIVAINKLKLLSFKPERSKDSKMFGAITAKDIADKLGTNGIEVDKHEILLAKPLKDFGTYTVAVKLYAGISTAFTVVIE